jgi:hypothetical protein
LEIGLKTQMCESYVYITFRLDVTSAGWPKTKIWGWAKVLSCCSFIATYTSHLIINLLGKNGSTEYSKGNKTVPGKVATTHTEDGHK